MAEIKLRVKLAADSLVDGVLREAGEIVELPESIAADFGTLYSPRAEKAAETQANAKAKEDDK